jgi:hypothetical protein
VGGNNVDRYLTPWLILGYFLGILVVGAVGVWYGASRQLAADARAREAAVAAAQVACAETVRAADARRSAAEAALIDAQSRALISYQDVVRERNDAFARLITLPQD